MLLPLSDAELADLQARLDALPEPMEPMDVSAIDGYLCGVLLQPQRPSPDAWWPHVADYEGKPAPAGTDLTPIRNLVLRRHAQLDAAIQTRQWFDPWVYQLDDEASASEAVLPWVAGFAAAMDLFPKLMDMADPELVEPMALMYMHFDPADLEDATALLEVIETLQPPANLTEAVDDVVRAVMLMADVSRPRPKPNSTRGRPKAKRGR